MALAKLIFSQRWTWRTVQLHDMNKDVSLIRAIQINIMSWLDIQFIICLHKEDHRGMIKNKEHVMVNIT